MLVKVLVKREITMHFLCIVILTQIHRYHCQRMQLSAVTFFSALSPPPFASTQSRLQVVSGRLELFWKITISR